MDCSTQSTATLSCDRRCPPVITPKKPTLALVTPSIVSTVSSDNSCLSPSTVSTVSTEECHPSRPLSRQPSRMNLTLAGSRKRLRRDSGIDEKREVGDATNHRPPRVRQRLKSQSSVRTLRASSNSSGPAETAEKMLTRATLSRQSSNSTIRRAPVRSNENQAPSPEDARLRALRRVGSSSILKSNVAVEDGEKATIAKTLAPQQTSRIPQLSRASSMMRHVRTLVSRRPSLEIGDTQERTCTSSLKHPGGANDGIPSKYKGPSREFVTPHEVAAKEAALARDNAPRFEITIASRKKHVELWDERDEHVYAWGGYLVLTDHKYTDEDIFPLEHLDICCSTHAYEGRFSLESNELPVYTTFYNGDVVDPPDVAALKRDYDPARGIVLHRDWVPNTERPGQWFVKFWVPIPLVLFRNRESRMFKFDAEARLLDQQTWTHVDVMSNTLFDDVSHLLRANVMERRCRATS